MCAFVSVFVSVSCICLLLESVVWWDEIVVVISENDGTKRRASSYYIDIRRHKKRVENPKFSVE